MYLLTVSHLFLLAFGLELLSFTIVGFLTLRHSTEVNKARLGFIYLIINAVMAIPMFIGVIQMYKFSSSLTYNAISVMFKNMGPTFNHSAEVIMYGGIY